MYIFQWKLAFIILFLDRILYGIYRNVVWSIGICHCEAVERHPYFRRFCILCLYRHKLSLDGSTLCSIVKFRDVCIQWNVYFTWFVKDLSLKILPPFCTIACHVSGHIHIPVSLQILFRLFPCEKLVWYLRVWTPVFSDYVGVKLFLLVAMDEDVNCWNYSSVVRYLCIQWSCDFFV
jgi:hypothetical protein